MQLKDTVTSEFLGVGNDPNPQGLGITKKERMEEVCAVKKLSINPY